MIRLAGIGSRSLTDYNLVYNSICYYYKIEDIELLISGGAGGSDKLCKRFSEQCKIPYKEFPADWSKGKHMGMVRNTDIIEACTHVICFYDGISKGSRDSINKAILMKKHLNIIFFEPPKSDFLCNLDL